MSKFSDGMEAYYRSRLAYYLHHEFMYDIPTCRAAVRLETRGPREGAECLKINEEDLSLAMFLAQDDWEEELRVALCPSCP